MLKSREALRWEIHVDTVDPSIILHEASHSVFHDLYQGRANPELDGINEGFADYLALSFLKSPDGAVFENEAVLQRKATHPPRYYPPFNDPHHLGHVVLGFFWQIRTLLGDPDLTDQVVLSLIQELNEVSFPTTSHLKPIILKNLMCD